VLNTVRTKRKKIPQKNIWKKKEREGGANEKGGWRGRGVIRVV
jgi:hypothetical protein